ncbi:MAG: NAD/NADP octopine/nopaline dehydrogenase family protein [Betaproteobacteria bacterium]|nr:NAD/NADP octopine/nopaline dehydrogenase family protein [Betaproteobacteria bacterium]
MRVTILGAGAGGAAAVADLMQAGHEVALWNRSTDTLRPFQRIGGIEYEGVLGEGTARPALITDNLSAALQGCDAVVCTLPTFSHAAVARGLAAIGLSAGVPVILNPGHTGGALEFRTAFRSVCSDVPPLAEFSTLSYVARKLQPQRVTVTGRAKQVRAAALPGGERALETARRLFPCASPVRDVLAANFCNVNMVLHPPGAVLGAAWIEAKAGDFTFYVEGMTPGVARVMKALDDERLAVARAFGHELPNLIEEMQRIGTVEAGVEDTQDFAGAIAGGTANSRIRAPDSLSHRYYLEDFGHGLLPFIVLAGIARVAVPVAEALFTLGGTLVGVDYRANGRTAEAMGIAGLDLAGLISLVRH